MSAPMRHEDFDDFPDTIGRLTGKTGLQQAEGIGFVAGTRVATPMGYVAVERLKAGDRVLTADGRHASLIWVGLTRVPCMGSFAPVRIDTGVMDNIRPLRLGQGHRLRVSGWQAELLFDAEAVLASAKTFVNGVDIVIDHSAETVTYIHLMFDRHEVVLAENVPCETLQPGPDAMRAIDELVGRADLVQQEPMPGTTDNEAIRAVLRILSRDEEVVLRAA
jgi:hypothetical protein